MPDVPAVFSQIVLPVKLKLGLDSFISSFGTCPVGGGVEEIKNKAKLIPAELELGISLAKTIFEKDIKSHSNLVTVTGTS